MEQLLIKMARQLDALDELPLALWDNTPSSFPISNPRSVGRKRRWFFVHSGQAVEKPVVQLAAGRRRCIPARRVAARRGAGLFLDPPTGRPAPAKPKRKAAIIQFRPHRSPEKDAPKSPARLRPQETVFPPDSRRRSR